MIRVQFADHVIEKGQLFHIHAENARFIEKIPPVSRRMVHVFDDTFHDGLVIGCGNPQMLQMNHCITVDGMDRVKEFLHRVLILHTCHCVIVKHVESELRGIPDLPDVHGKNRQRSKRFSVHQRDFIAVIPDRRNVFVMGDIHCVIPSVRTHRYFIQPLAPPIFRAQGHRDTVPVPAVRLPVHQHLFNLSGKRAAAEIHHGMGTHRMIEINSLSQLPDFLHCGFRGSFRFVKRRRTACRKQRGCAENNPSLFHLLSSFC